MARFKLQVSHCDDQPLALGNLVLISRQHELGQRHLQQFLARIARELAVACVDIEQTPLVIDLQVAIGGGRQDALQDVVTLVQFYVRKPTLRDFSFGAFECDTRALVGVINQAGPHGKDAAVGKPLRQTNAVIGLGQAPGVFCQDQRQDRQRTDDGGQQQAL